MVTTKMSIADFGENTLYQGDNYDQGTDTHIHHRADNVPGQIEQNVEFILTDSDGTKISKNIVVKGGHGSSTGLVIDDDGIYELWFGHDGFRISGYIRIKRGVSGTSTFIKTELPEGDIEIDQANNRLILRNNDSSGKRDRYRVYELDSVRKNSARDRVKISEFYIPHWGLRWQGMYITEGRLLIHRDFKTKGASRAQMFDLEGRPVNFPGSNQNWIDTSRMGDEAEGFITKSRGNVVDVYVVKRTGPPGTKRTIWMTLVASLPKLKTPWDGKTFPGADAFDIGSRHPAVKTLGERLVIHGWKGYKNGPGIPMSETDKNAVRWFQEKQGWSGSGADGIPGPQTWKKLLEDPVDDKVDEEEDDVKIVSRAAWGAKPWAGQPATVPMSSKRHFLVHYHGGPVSDQYGVEVPRLVENIHLANGWSGPGYNFMVDMDGVAYEGRGWTLVGAHCPGRNVDGIGVYVAVGGTQIPTPAALNTVRDLYAEAVRRSGRFLERCYHSKHYATSCPGDFLRAWVDARMPEQSDYTVPEDPTIPVVETPMKFPGASAFVLGSPHPAVTELGEMLVKHGWKGYRSGPGIPMGTADVKGTQWFQGLQGWDGDGADGIPGKLTWEALLKTPTTRPTPPPNGAPIFGRVTTRFKAKGSWAWSQGHPGEDWNGDDPDYGNPVFAIRSGVVVYIGKLPWDQKSGNSYGDRALIIQDDVGTTQTLYGHMSSVKVRRGQRVQVGDIVGAIGFSGNVNPANKQGSHVHVERRMSPYRYGTDVVKPVYGD